MLGGRTTVVLWLLLESLEKAEGERQELWLWVELGAFFARLIIVVVVVELLVGGENEASLRNRGTLRANVANWVWLGSTTTKPLVDAMGNNFTGSSSTEEGMEEDVTLVLPPPPLLDTSITDDGMATPAWLNEVGSSTFCWNCFICSVNLCTMVLPILDFSRNRIVSEKHSWNESDLLRISLLGLLWNTT